MILSRTTEWGTILLDKEIVASILRRAIEPMEKKIMFSDSRGKIRRNASKPGVDDSFFTVELSNEEQVLNLELFLIIRFGTSIKDTSASISAKVREDVTAITGLRVGTFKIVFLGVISKNLSKRRVEVITYDE
jgi:uncharacterized alkaline shock family protein YloU